MASKMRVEFVRLRTRNANGLQDMDQVSNAVPITKAVNGTALTGTGAGATNRVLVPNLVGGQNRFHARIVSDVEILVTLAPAGDAGTSYDAAVGIAGGIAIPANTPTLIPVTPGQLISAATGLTYA